MILYFVNECIIYSSKFILSVLCLCVTPVAVFLTVDFQAAFRMSLHYTVIHKFKYSSILE